MFEQDLARVARLARRRRRELRASARRRDERDDHRRLLDAYARLQRWRRRRRGLRLRSHSERRRSCSERGRSSPTSFFRTCSTRRRRAAARRAKLTICSRRHGLHARGIRDRRRVNQVANLADVGWHENNVIGARGPADYVPRLREKLGIDDDRWGRMCAEHALPPGWESMEYEDVSRASGDDGWPTSSVSRSGSWEARRTPRPLTPPWFLPGAESRLAADRGDGARAACASSARCTRHAFGEAAAQRIEEAPAGARTREPRPRAPGAARGSGAAEHRRLPLPRLSYRPSCSRRTSGRKPAAASAGHRTRSRRLQAAISQIAPVRNEIAHVREVEQDRLLRATVACADVLAMLQGRPPAPRQRSELATTQLPPQSSRATPTRAAQA